jgi:hypothetical protein
MTLTRFSTTAQKMFDAWGKTINIKFEKDKFRAGKPPAKDVGSGIIYIDLSFFNGVSYINDRGKALQYSLFGGIIHEIAHALTGKIDNTTDTDYQGDNVRKVNKIWAELSNPMGQGHFSGLDKMISYLGQASNDPKSGKNL